MIDILSILHYDEFTGTGATGSPYLMGSFMDKITTKVQVSVHWETLSLLCTFNSSAKTITRNDNRSFYDDEWSVGDTFAITGTASNNGNFTIAIISANGSTITTVESLTNESTNSANLYGKTSVNCLDFYFNLIENSATFSVNSLTDTNQPCKKTASKTTWSVGDTVDLVQATTSLGWDNGSGTVTRNSDVGYNRIFTIQHTYFVSPYYLAGQQVCTGKTTGTYLTNPAILSWGSIVYPSYFSNNNSLKYVCSVNSRTSLSNPNTNHSTNTSYPFQLGNIGYLNEFLNGGTPNYSFTNETIQYSFGGSAYHYNIDFNCISQFESYINVADGSVTTGGLGLGTNVIIDFIYCPQTTPRYSNTTTNMNQNFLLDRVVMACGNSGINGENYGTQYQVLDEAYANPVDANTILFGFRINPSSYVKNFIKNLPIGNRKVMITATFQKASVTDLQTTDRNAVLIYFDNCRYNLEDSTLLSFTDTTFHQFPDTTLNTFTDYKGFIGDTILSKSYFTVDNTAKLTSVSAEIQAINIVTGETITLQKTNNSIQNDDGICQPIQETNRYKLPLNSPFNQTVFNRNVALDTETTIGYEFDYGFIGRYETWVTVPEASKSFTCENFQDWSVYSLEPNWTLALVITADVLKDNYTTTFIHQSPFTLYDETYSESGFMSQLQSEIKTYYQDVTGYVDAKGLILRNQNTHVVMIINGDFNSLPSSATGYAGYLALDMIDSGGVYYRDMVDTQNQPLNDSLWIEQSFISVVDTSTIMIEADIDYTKINPTMKSFTITGRLYYTY